MVGSALLATPSLVAFGAVLPHGVSDLLVTLAITALVTLGLLHGIGSRAPACAYKLAGKEQSRTKSGVLGLIATLGRGSTAAALAAEKVARMEDDIVQVDANRRMAKLSAQTPKVEAYNARLKLAAYSAPDLL